MNAATRIGVIGTGTVGSAMVKALLHAGYNVTVHDKFQKAAEPLLSMGAQWYCCLVWFLSHPTPSRSYALALLFQGSGAHMLVCARLLLKTELVFIYFRPGQGNVAC